MYLYTALQISLLIPLISSSALLPRQLFGGNAVTTSKSTSIGITCNTLQGLLPVPIVPTQTFALLNLNPIPLRATATSTPTVFATPAPLTLVNNITSTVVTTVLVSVESDVFSSTLTVVSTILDRVVPPVVTSYTTTTSTQTTYTSTSSVGAPALFEGVLQTGLPAAKRLKPRAASTADEESETAVSKNELRPRSINDGTGIFDGRGIFNIFQSNLQSLVAVLSGRTPLYPLAVNCQRTTYISTIITTIILGPAVTQLLPPATVTRTSTILSTSTLTHAQSTITSTVTTTTTSLTTSTTTFLAVTSFIGVSTTLTLSLPTTTYLACATAINALGPILPAAFGDVAGDVVSDILYDSSSLSLVTTVGSTDSAYSCCAQCIADGSCAFGGWDPAGVCYLLELGSGTCSANGNGNGEGGQYVSSVAGTESMEFGVYNGGCGYVSYGGADPNTS